MPATRSIYSATAALACVAVALSAPAPGAAQSNGRLPVALEVRQQSRELLTAQIAEQLGVKPSPGQAAELAIGNSITASLVDPAKLAAFGIRDAQPGARVTIMRVGPERLRVEVDELDPVPRTRRLTLRVDSEGKLTPVS